MTTEYNSGKSISNIKRAINDIRHILDKQALQLEYHIKRTDQLEDYIKRHDVKYLELTESIKKEIPLLLGIIRDANQNQTKTLLKLLSFGGIALSTMLAVIHFILRINW